jgi:hypothetical protein
MLNIRGIMKSWVVLVAILILRESFVFLNNGIIAA